MSEDFDLKKPVENMVRKIIPSLFFGLLTFVLGWLLGSLNNSTKGSVPGTKITESFGDNKNKITLTSDDKSSNKVDTIINDEFELVVKEADGQVNVWRKFKPKKKFDDYPVSKKFKGKIPKHLNFSLSKFGDIQKEASRHAAANGPNFAGHYAFNIIGCGTECQVSTIVDLITGNVYHGPQATRGYDFRISSNLLIVNPTDSNGLYSPQFAIIHKPELYLWTNNSLKRVQ